MTPDAKPGGDLQRSTDRERPEAPPTSEAPVLVPLGNVHALLAGTGSSPTSDGTKNTHRPP